MRRHNKKGNGFYKIAKATPKYVSIDAVLVKVAQDYLRKIAEAPANGTLDPDISNSADPTEETTAPPSTGTSAEPKTQTASQPTATESPAPRKPEEAPQASEGALATEPSSGGKSVGKPLESVAQETKPQPANVSPAPGDTASSQPGAIGTEKTEVTSGPKEKTDVVEAPARKEPPNYLKNLALLIGIPLTIASLAGGAIRGFGMSNLIGLGLGAAATMYGVGFLDSVLHPKAMLHEEIENLKRNESFNYLRNPRNSASMVGRIYNRRDIKLKDLPLDHSIGSDPPEEFKTLYRSASDYLMRVYLTMPTESRPFLYYIFGYSTAGAPPQTDMLNSLDKGSDLERHATIILLADLLKRVENHSGSINAAVDLLGRLLAETPYYWNPWRSTRPFLADPRTFVNALGQVVIKADLPEGIRTHMMSLGEKPLSQCLSEAAKNLMGDDQEAQPQ